MLSSSATSARRLLSTAVVRSAGGSTAAAAGGSVRIVAEDRQGAVAGVSVHVDAGSRDDFELAGVAHFVQRAAFKSTASRSVVRFAAEAGKAGVHLSSAVSREHIALQGVSLRENVDTMVALLGDALVNSQYLDRELRDVRGQVANDIASVEESAPLLVREALHAVAYGGAEAGGLSRSVACPRANVDAIQRQHIQNFVARYVTAPNVVVSAVNVGADEIAAAVEKHMAGLSVVEAPKRPASEYVGGSQCLVSPSEESYFALAYEAPSAAAGKDYWVAQVVRALLDTPVLSLPTAHMSSAFHAAYSDSALLGLYAHTPGSGVSEAVERFQATLSQMASTGVAADALQAAKARVAFAAVSSVESASALSDWNATQVRVSGAVDTPKAVRDAVMEIGTDDVRRVMAELVKGKPTFVAVGNQASVPSLETISSRLSA